MKIQALLFSIFLSCFLLPAKSHAQITIADTLSANALVGTLFGTGVDVVLDTIICDTSLAIREFDATNSNLDLFRGLLMSTGAAADAPGPNLSPNTGTILPSNGYGPLQVLSGNITHDACVIEFDITPFCDSIGIRYVFASEEYNEFALSNFNDVFAFYISGPGFTAPAPGENIALVPGATIPVAINNVNNGSATPSTGPCTNCQYYFDNTGGASVEFDGFTTPLVAGARVTPCETYHITLAIADVGDEIYDSGVFLEVGGITCLSEFVDITARHGDVADSSFVVEGCNNSFGFFEFNVPQPLQNTKTYNFTIGGTATPGLDYVPIANSITIPAGSTSGIIPVAILADNIPEGTETIELIYVDSFLCASSVYIDTAILEIRDLPINIQSLVDTFTCSDISIPVGITPDSNQVYTWTPTTYLSDPTAGNPLLIPNDSTTFPYTLNYLLEINAFEGVCLYDDNVQIDVKQGNYASVIVDTVCEGNPTSFQATSSGFPITNWSWDFGELGASSTLPAPFYTYSSAGTYPGVLVAFNTDGCLDTVRFPVVVDGLVGSGFAAHDVCLGDTTFLTNPNDPVGTYIWDFGDGSPTVSAFTPAHLYLTADTFTITLIGVSPDGCQDTSSQEVIVYEAPQAAFIADTVCIGLTSNFLNNSTPSNGLSFAWDFGDATTSNDINPTHIYTTADTFPVTLIATQAGGLCADTLIQDVIVGEVPVAAFLSDSACEGSSVTLNNLSSASISVTSLWILGNGDSSSLTSPVITYASPGTYDVILIASLPNSCSDTASDVVTVYENPQADFTADSVCEGLRTTFQNLTIAGSSADLAYDWDLGDNNTTIDPNPLYRYDSSGLYSVVVIVTDSNGCTDDATQDILVREPPLADFELLDGCEDADLDLIDFSIPGDDVTLTYQWTDIYSNQFQGPNPSIANLPVGAYGIELILLDGAGCADTLTRNSTIFEIPQVAFEVLPVCQGASTVFTNQTQSNQPLAYAWDFGDTDTSSLISPTKLYDTFGTFTTTLIATTPQGCTDTLSQDAVIYQNPRADYTVDDVCENAASLFVNVSEPGDGQTLTFDWDLGDNTTLDVTAPDYVYATYGTYNTLLTVSDENGCTDQLSLAHQVFAKPTADFRADDACALSKILLTNETQIADGQLFRAFNWRWGDGETARGDVPDKAYDAPGFYDIRLIAETENGCLDTANQNIQVFANPVAAFDFIDACFPDSITFLNLSSIDNTFGDMLDQSLWNFGDGTRTTNLDLISKAYINPGTYVTSLEVVSNNGCEALTNQSIQIDPTPLPPTLQSDTVCFGEAGRLIALPANGSHTLRWYNALSDDLPFLESRVYIVPQVVNSDLFWVEASTAKGCVSDRLPISLEMWPGRAPEILVSDSILEVPSAIVELRTKEDDFISYEWDFGDGNVSNASQPAHEYRTPGKYLITVKLIDAQGCTYEAKRLVEVKEIIAVWVPSAFSPNGDNSNDKLQVQSRLIQSMEFEVYHRWGGRLFASDELNPAWDGRGLDGQLVNPGVYVYKAAYVDINGRSAVQTGTITVLR
ncbi:MAG: PKD domain-containing protein [Bacteroidota bacterium]